MITGQTLIMSLLLFFIMKLAVTMAEKIGSVSIESAPKSASNINRDATQNAKDYSSLGSNMAKGGAGGYSGAKGTYENTKGYVQSKLSNGVGGGGPRNMM